MKKQLLAFSPTFLKTLFLLSAFVNLGFLQSQKKLDLETLDDAVGVLLLYDNNNKLIGNGSCFCIDPNGFFYSNYKFFKHCHHAEVRLGNGEIYKVTKISAANENKDLIKFQVKKPGGQQLPFLEIEKKLPKKGADAVAICAPFNSNLMDKIAHGYIYNIYTDDIAGVVRIQTAKTTPMMGSGNPVLNAYGRVIGITSNRPTENSTSDYIDWAIEIDEFEKIKQVNLTKVSEDNLKLINTNFYINTKGLKNDVSLFVDDKFIGSFERSFDSIRPVCGSNGTVNTKLSEGKHNFYALEHSSGSVWKSDFTISTNDSCALILVSNSQDQVSSKMSLDQYDQSGIIMNKPIDVSSASNNNNSNSGSGSNSKKNTGSNSSNNSLDNYKNYFRFDAGFEHQNFMAHDGWPTYAVAFQFEKTFENTPFSRNYRISVGMNDSSDFYLHMPAGPIAGVLLLMIMNSQQNYCSGIAASTLLFILPDGFGFNPVQNEKMEFGVYANFLGVDFCQSKRRKPNGSFYSPIDYAPDFGARFNYYFNKQVYLFSRVSAKYSTIFAGWGAQATVGIGFEFEK